MSVRVFVSSSALVIFAWLTATYLRTVPMETYPAGVPSQAEVMAPESPPAAEPESTIMVSTKDPLTVSVSSRKGAER